MKTKVNQISKNLRKKWKLDSCIPIDLDKTLAKNYPKLTIIYYPMSISTSGMSINFKNNQFIGINSHMSKGHQRFTIAHELYHLICNEGFKEELIICSYLNKDINESEKEADLFASYLILPSEGLEKFIEEENIKKWTLDDIIKLEQLYQISHKGTLTRLKHEKLITNREYLDLSHISINYESKKRGFNNDLYGPSKLQYFTTGYYISLIMKVSGRRKISPIKKEKLLSGCFRKDLIM